MDLTEEGFKMKIEVCHVEKSLKGREVLKDISCVMENLWPLWSQWFWKDNVDALYSRIDSYRSWEYYH